MRPIDMLESEMRDRLVAKDAEIDRLQEQLEAVTRELSDMTSRYNKACVDIDAKDYRAEAAEARAARQREAIAEIQAIAMLAEGNATLSAIGRVARAALSEDSVKEAG